MDGDGAFHVEVAGGRLAAQRAGAGATPIVMLHAGVADRRSWREVAGALADLGTIVAYDRRGFGETPVAEAPFSHLDDLVAVIETLGARPAWLVGSSMGGSLALDCALAHPRLVAGLVLLAPGVSGAPEDAPLDPATEALWQRVEAALAEGDLTSANRFETWLWLDGPGAPEGRVGSDARELALAMNAIVLAAGEVEHAGTSGVCAHPRVGEVQARTTIVVGELDVPLIVEAGRELARRIPHARLLSLPARAHLPYLEDPAQIATAIRDAVCGRDRAA